MGLLPDVRSLTSSLFSDGIWVLAGAALALIFRLARTMDRFASLRRAFGSNVSSADDVAIYLPLWRVQDRSRSETRFEKQVGSGERRQFYGPDRTFAEADARGAFEAAQAFARFFSRPIDMRPDDQPLRENESTVLIGSHVANRHVDSVLHLHRCDCPDRMPIDFPPLAETDENAAVFFVKNNATGEEYRFNGALDYAYILRLPKVEDGEGYHFIVAGIDASGTQAAGAMLRRRWQMFGKHGGPAACVLSLQRGRPETARVVTWIFRGRRGWISKPGSPRS